MAPKDGYQLLATEPPSYDASTASMSYPPRPRSSRPAQLSLESLMRGPPNPEPPIDPVSARRWALPEHNGWNHTEVWDSTLDDADNLYDFVRAKALNPPSVDMRIYSSPDNTFSVRIDLSPLLSTGTVCTRSRLAPGKWGRRAWSLPPPSTTGLGRHPTEKETDGWKAWVEYRDDRGLPPWADPTEYPEFSYSGPMPTDVEEPDGLYQWCEAYAADQGLLKRFVIYSPVWGWDMGAMKATITRAITDAGRQGSVVVDFQTPRGWKNPDRLIVRPDNILTRLRPYLWFPPLAVLFLVMYILLRVTGHGGERLRCGGCML